MSMSGKTQAMMAMMAALSSGMNIQGDYRIPQKGYESTPSSLTRKEAKERRNKNKAAKKARRRNRKR